MYMYMWYIVNHHLEILHFYGDANIAGDEPQNLGLYSALRTFEQGRILIVTNLLLRRNLVFGVS